MTIQEARPQVLTAEATLGVALRHPEARALLENRLPELRDTATKMILGGRALGLVLATSPALEGNVEAARSLLNELAALPPHRETPRSTASRPSPAKDYEAPSTEVASAAASHPDRVSLYRRFELSLSGPSHGNPYVDVVLEATIDTPGGPVEVPGFYDGDGQYRLRYLCGHLGEHRVRTRSNARSLHGVEATFVVDPAEPSDHGPVRVERTFHFAFSDGSRYIPVGTTAYAWTHQGDEMESRTLSTLAASSFNKIRMCVFPKSYLFNENEPERFPFVGDLDRGFDLQRFDPVYWRHLEQRIEGLQRLGIEADLILFHPYDRWGFSSMDPESDDAYLRYAVARLASMPNVWWSLANEYDLMADKTEQDWERFASLVQMHDPVGHLLSIHNCYDFYDHGRPWVTHASVQRQDLYKTSEMTTEWRLRWNKPVVIDECAYEGDIDQGWGNITGEEMVRRFWEGAVRGGYVGHGETYLRPDEVLWWAKGGELRGTSPSRIAFLRQIIEAAPRNVEPLEIDWDIPSLGVEGEYYLFYYGSTQPRFRRFVWDPAVSYEVDLIDTWNMTIETLPGTFRGRFNIELPARPYQALQFRARKP
jgi:hypothetical protein